MKQELFSHGHFQLMSKVDCRNGRINRAPNSERGEIPFFGMQLQQANIYIFESWMTAAYQ